MCASRSTFRRFQFWSVMLLSHVSVAQQYTGVKSVSSSPEAIQQQAHSARSVDGGIPATDSNIINLAITPFARGQGFSAAKGRNLGFANDASLNAIPSGINNELSNVDVRGSTLQPNTVLRDSYGNPVTPFTDLAKPELDSVGFLTNVNRDANFQSSGQGSKVGPYNFKVPSYASGIIEPIAQPNFGLLPPNPVPSTVQVVPPSSTTTARSPITQPQFLPNAKIPNIEDGKILFAQKPVNGLLPPLFPDQLPPVYDIKVGTERSTYFVRDPFVDPVKPTSLQTLQPPQSALMPDGGVGFKTDVNQQTHFPQPNTLTVNRFSGSAAPNAPAFETTTKPVVQKYSGGFGGPAGFLGNQQNIGTVYTSTVRPNIPQAIPSATQPQPRPQTIFTPQNTFSTTARPVAKPTVQKYMGSFGGAPGFLGNQANIGTAYTKAPQTIAAITPTVAPVQQPPAVQHFGIAHPVPVPTSTLPQRPLPPSAPSVPNNYNGQFNGAPANQGSGIRPTAGSTFTPPLQPVRPVSATNTFTGGNKFTGSFGGAPGILGNQQRPGTHVKPDGSLFPSTLQQLPQQHQQPHQSLSQQLQQPKPATDTFTGSFGGPPGVLRPFDNTKG
ncbi:uncharacterized protein LOC128710056 [Anopheles marshallii]|uniref:uncharacterized protein LOC128710056 n=1 Tax=Anopheles marshallii TaxID=1521116 RepID=UPI00237C271F|nr:uncharacterized protein LOC128710056 [Anopheles marshallii]